MNCKICHNNETDNTSGICGACLVLKYVGSDAGAFDSNRKTMIPYDFLEAPIKRQEKQFKNWLE